MSNQSIIENGKQHIMNTYGRFPISLVKGQGSKAWDADGKEYLDFVAGIAVCSFGHANPELADVLKKQADQFWHCSNLYWIEPQVELAGKLCQATGMDKAFFCNSGTEANEAALKLARKYYANKGEDRTEIIAFQQSFHGRTTGSLALTGQAKYQKGFGPLIPGVHYAEYNNLDSVKKLIGSKTCAVIVEAVQGEGGVHPADPAFMTGLAALCKAQGVLLITDEVQVGLGRTGTLMGYENYGIKPDIATLAKALGNGFPIGALLAHGEVADTFAPGDHAATFGGNPLGTAVANKVMDILTGPGFLDSVNAVSNQLLDGLKALVGGDDRVTAVRGMGLLIGMECKSEVKGLVALCMDRGLLVISAGPNVLRMVPPLTVTPAEVEAALAILKDALAAWEA
ncbi:MAG: aspartate aminotransferase family protein [Solirubrobacterales bacterium]